MISSLAAILDGLASDRARDVVLAVDGRSVTGAELERMARTHAARVLGLGLRPGDRVAVNAPASIELVAALLAHLRLGLLHVPLNTRCQPPEIAHVLADSGAHDLGADLAPRGEPLAQWPEPPTAEQAALVVYTSGTTGKPKGVMLSHGALATNLGAMMDLWGIGVSDVVSHGLPLFHVHGLGLGLLGPLLAGACVRLHARFDATAIVADFAWNATVFLGVPTMYHALLEHLAAHPDDGAVLGRGRLFTAGSAALPVTQLERFQRATGHTILERYGMTETLFTLSNPLVGERRPGTVGLPVGDVDVRLIDDAGQPAAEGEIEVRGPGLMSGYWGNADATEKSYRDGWFRTGDIALRDADGYYRIIGRSSTDIIKCGGFKIGAREIEDVLAAHPRVGEVAVVGIADAKWGEVVAAAVVPSAGPATGLDAELFAWVADKLADFKRPRRIVVVSTLPRNGMGKVVKAQVRELFTD